MISNIKDYDVTSSLNVLSRLYHETKREYDDLKVSMGYKEKRLKAIHDRMEKIISENEEYQIALDNFLEHNSHYQVVNFVESLLNTRDKKTVMEYIEKTLKLSETDHRYTKRFWEEAMKNGVYTI